MTLWRAWCALIRQYHTPPNVVEYIKRRDAKPYAAVIANPPYTGRPRCAKR